METGNIQFVPVDQEYAEGPSFDFKGFVNRCFRNWYWFAISIVVCLGLAGFYILKTRPVYSRGATILIKESATRRMATSDIESVLSFSGGSTMSSKVVNEVIAFQSPALMQETVKRLGLTTEYFAPSLFRSNVIYGVQVPVTVDFIDVPSNVNIALRIEKQGENNCIVSKLTYYLKGDKYKLASANLAFGDTLSTEIGKIAVRQSEYFSGEWKKAIEVRHYTLDGATAMYSSRLKAEPTDMKNKSDVLDIKIKDFSVQRADDIVNTLINVYNESWVEDKNKMAVSTSDFIEDRLVALEKELGDVDNNISDFKSQNLLPDLTAVSDLYMTQTKETARLIQELGNQLYVFRYVKTYLTNNPGTETLIPAATSISSSSIASQISEYNKLLLQRNNIRANSSDRNPLVQDLNAALLSTRTAIETAIDNQIGTTTEQIENLKGVERRNNSRIAQSPTQAKYLMSVGRQQKVKESLYLYLLQKREENELSQAFTAYNTRVITPPMGAAKPTHPKKMQILLVALFLGLFLPLAFFYIREIVDTKVRSRNDLSDLSLPFLGEVPYYVNESARGLSKIVSKDMPHNEIVVKPGARNVVNEAFRVIRTNLEFMERGNKCPVLILCSFNPGSGKTFLSVNISAALAIKGHKVLVIDGDLRRRSLSEYVGLPNKGLSNYLAGEEPDIHKYIVPGQNIEGLDVLPVGKIPPNPSELVSLPLFKQLIEGLRKEYDYIIIDCPPVDIVADTQIIEESSDRTIFVVRAGVLDRKDVSVLQKAYDKKRFKNLCYIFNGVDSNASYYGHYGNYGGYGKKSRSYYGKV